MLTKLHIYYLASSVVLSVQL